MGDFNARTRSEQCEAYDHEDPEALHTLDEEATMRDTADRAPVSLRTTSTSTWLPAPSRYL